MKGWQELPLVYRCQGEERLAIITRPAEVTCRLAVLIVVGGAQYRIGSHRQFTLLARHLAEQGISSMRFDYSGHGDSDGQALLGMSPIDHELSVAIDIASNAMPHVTGFVLWGLCGAASAIAIYAVYDDRVKGLVMLNPWVRTEDGLAKARLKHYYVAQLTDREFWRRLATGKVTIGKSISSLARTITQATDRRIRGPRARGVDPDRQVATTFPGQSTDSSSLPERMLGALQRAGTPTLVVLSGDKDLTANEFRDLCSRSKPWGEWLRSRHVTVHEIAGSNHTFASRDWRNEVEVLTNQWTAALCADDSEAARH